MKQLTADEIATIEHALGRAARIELAMHTIAEGREIITGTPRMDGTFEQHPRLINRARMMEIAREVLEDGEG